MGQVELYDTTLRDGAQQEGISFSVEDKIAITKMLDEFGVDFIEGGWPGSNPKDAEFFQAIKSIKTNQATVVSFGMTRKANSSVEDDPTIRSLIDSDTEVVTLVGKASDLHVTDVLGTSLQENLNMISDSVSYIRDSGPRVFFDAEHFFDGLKRNPAYSLECVKAAANAGAERIILCDTNGGTLPDDVREGVITVKAAVDVPIGIHMHNDSDVAVAGSLAAVAAGVLQVQGCINGYGERCGNANLISVIANLKIKLGYDCISNDQMAKLADTSALISEIANMTPDPYMPYVGASAFSHKAGLHANAVAKFADSYQHISPDVVGNENSVLISEMAGRGNVLRKINDLGIHLDSSPGVLDGILADVKDRENHGFQYELADASFELIVRRAHPDYKALFDLIDFMVVIENRRRASNVAEEDLLSEAMVKVRIGGDTVRHVVSEGKGPVNALDTALRKALIEFCPNLDKTRLVDFKVRVVDEGSGTGAIVRVLIESTDGDISWRTVGASSNIIEACWIALADSIEWWMINRGSD